MNIHYTKSRKCVRCGTFVFSHGVYVDCENMVTLRHYWELWHTKCWNKTLDEVYGESH